MITGGHLLVGSSPWFNSPVLLSHSFTLGQEQEWLDYESVT